MELQEIIDINAGRKPRYVRKGKCLQCGACCSNENCEHLTWKNGKAVCAIHKDPSRAQKCKEFPANPPIIIETCGYYFYDTIEKKVLKPREI